MATADQTKPHPTALEAELADFHGKVSLAKALPYGIQHVLAMFVANLAPIAIICAAAGFGLAMILFSCIRERLALANMPKWMNGFPGALITAGLMAIAFMGFGGLIG